VNSCVQFKSSPVKDNPVNDKAKREKNINEGRGITAQGLFNTNKKGQFNFASSNAMWRATISVLDFTPLSNVDYGGGIVITDWFFDEENINESIKISVQFLSNEIRVDGLNVQIYKKKCNIDKICKTKKIKSKLNNEIKLAILKKAAQIKISDGKKSREGKQPYVSGGLLK
tara:strand:- start:301 stop:813 length:513 start_codon:yes stop_codon:yes gene_type:complete